MTANTPLGFPYPEVTDRVADGYDAVHDLAVALDSYLSVQLPARATDAELAAEAAARAGADAALDTRLDAIEAAHADTGWVGLTDGGTLATGWLAYGSGFVAPAYRRRAGIVHLRGMVKASGIPEHALQIFTLPAGYRPGGIHIFTGTGQLSGAGLTDVGIRVEIDAGGNVKPTNLATSGGGAVAWVSMSGISFPADA